MATKQIEIENNCILKLDSSVGWLLIYRENFGRDILPDILPIISATVDLAVGIVKNDEISLETLTESLDNESVESALFQLSGLELTTIINIIWALAKNYAKKNNENIAPVDTWIDQFDVFPFDEIIPAAFKLIAKSSMSSKNLRSLQKKLEKSDLVQKISLSAESPEVLISQA